MKEEKFPYRAVRILEEAAEALERGAVLEDEGLTRRTSIVAHREPITGPVLDLPTCDRKLAVCQIDPHRWVVMQETCKRAGIRYYEVVGEAGSAASAHDLARQVVEEE